MNIIIQSYNQQITPNFKGLVSNATSIPVSFGDNIRYFEHTKYYPFKNETKESIDNFVKSASMSSYGRFREICRSVSIEKELPFTEEEFFSYKGKPSKVNASPETIKLIDETLSKIGNLKRYMNRTKETLTSPKTDSLITVLTKSIRRLFK